jgi:DNA-directed RNA polymerase subunit RPC12/RpoP
MNTKLIILIAVLVVGAGVSAILWTRTTKETGGDNAVMGKTESYTCSKCGKTFQKTTQAIIDERRAGGGHIKCPNCGELDPEKEGLKVILSGPTGNKAGGEAKTFESDEQAAKEGEEQQPADGQPKPKLSPPGQNVLKRKG